MNAAGVAGAAQGVITAVARKDTIAAADQPPVPWWSFGKTVLAAAALALVAKGVLGLDAPLPGHGFSLRQLLQHRAGLPDYGQLDRYHLAVARGDAPWSVIEMLDCARGLPAPTGWAYSNIGYLFVRQAIEAATGSELGAALEALVLRPLGIGGVRLALVPADLVDTAWGNAALYHPGWVYHGLLVGSASAAAALLQRLLDGALLPPGLMQAMTTAWPVGGRIPGRPWSSAGYGLGLMIGEAAGGRYIGHTGGGPGRAAAVYRRVGGACAAAAFARCEDPGVVEDAALSLARDGWSRHDPAPSLRLPQAGAPPPATSGSEAGRFRDRC